MSKRIPLSDRALITRVNSAMSDLESYYPDRDVYQLDQLHKGLSNRIGQLWQEVGYSSREEMLDAYGFRLVKMSGVGGGRPVTVDGEAIIAELKQRYEGVPKPRAYGVLLNENPDLKGQLKTLANKSNEIFGQSLAKELADRGLLAKRVSQDQISDSDIKSAISKLETIYSSASQKPSTIAALKNLHPELKSIFAVMPGRCELIYGCSPKKLLVDKGVLKPSKGAIPDADDADIERAINELGKLLCDKRADDKPKTLTDLYKEYPNYEGLLRAGKKKGILDKEPLQKLGILAPTKALLKKAGIRRAASDDLAECFLAVADDGLIAPDGELLAALPAFVAGVDVENLVELREILIGVKGDFAKRLEVGEKVSASIQVPPRESYEPLTVKFSCGVGMGYIHTPAGCVSIFSDVVKKPDSSLSAFEEAIVVSTSSRDKLFYAQIRYRFLANLNNDTLAYALRAMGVVKKKDMQGGMGWRFRVRMAELGEFSAKQPNPSRRATRVMHPSAAAKAKTKSPSSSTNHESQCSPEFVDAEVIEDRKSRRKSGRPATDDVSVSISNPGFSFSAKSASRLPDAEAGDSSLSAERDRPLLGGFGISRKGK